MNSTTEQLSKLPQLIAYRSLYRSRVKHSKLNQWFPLQYCIVCVCFQTDNSVFLSLLFHYKSQRNRRGGYEVRFLVCVKINSTYQVK